MRCAVLSAIVVVAGGTAHGLTLDDCARTTHPSHGGEARHIDIGGGRVAYVEWWSQEGVYHDHIIADCASGETLSVRAHEERISERLPFDRRAKVEAILNTAFSAAPAFFNFEQLASALHPTGKDIRIQVRTLQPCACAAAYPDLTGYELPFGGLSK